MLGVFFCLLPPEGAQNVLVFIGNHGNQPSAALLLTFRHLLSTTSPLFCFLCLPAVYLTQTYEAESRWAQRAPERRAVSAVSRGRREGGVEKEKSTTSTGDKYSAHSCILQPRSLFACSLSIFTRLRLPLNSSQKHLSAVLFSAKK